MQYLLIGIDCAYASTFMLLLIGAIWVFGNFGQMEGVSFLVGAAILEHFLLRRFIFTRLRLEVIRRSGHDVSVVGGANRLGPMSIELWTIGNGGAKSADLLGIVKVYVIAVYAGASFAGIQSVISTESIMRGVHDFISIWLIGMTGYALAVVCALIFGNARS